MAHGTRTRDIRKLGPHLWGPRCHGSIQPILLVSGQVLCGHITRLPSFILKLIDPLARLMCAPQRRLDDGCS
jgi:hypothetical protein